jgi:ketosteroid isomerase-like protein
MKMQTEGAAYSEIVREAWRVWAVRDKAAILALMTSDTTYALFVPQEVLPFGGEANGKAAVSDRLQTILDVFDTIKFEGEVVKVVGNVVHGRVAYCFRHKITGEDIDGTLRQVIGLRDGLIVSWHEYTDIERVKAFMRLVATSAAEQRHGG